MATVRSRRWWSLWCLAAGLTVAATCGDASPVKRGFSSHQLLAVRDPSIRFTGWQDQAWIFTTGVGPSSIALEYWSLDLETGAAVDLGPTLPPYTYPTPPPQRYACRSSYDGTSFSAFITDSQTGVTTTLNGFVDSWTCPSNEDPTLQIWLQDGARRIAFWTGPYDHLTQAPIDLIVREIKDFDPKIDAGVKGWFVVGSPLSEPDRLGLFRIDATTFAVTPMVAPTLDSAAWADGSTPEGSLDSSTLSGQFFLSLREGHYIYSRSMSDGGATLFAGPFLSDPIEVALKQLGPSSKLDDLQTWNKPTLLYSDPAGGTDFVLSFDTKLRRLTQCPSPFSMRPNVTQDPTGAFEAVWSEFSVARPLLLIASGICQTVAADDVIAFGFSPDRTAMAWLERPRGGDGTFWTAALDGTGARALGGGTITDVPNGPRFFGSGGDLQFQLGQDLVWMDVHDDPVRLHYVAEHLSGRAIDLGKYLVATYEYSAQDGTGKLAVIERATGAKRLISPDVGTFDSASTWRYEEGHPLAPLTPEYNPTDVYQFVYLVRGRNPSPQDGIWIATIPAAELQ
jgi:hypothetical protein